MFKSDQSMFSRQTTMTEKPERSSRGPVEKKSTILRNFYENSTLHGLRHVFTSENLVLKLVWLVLILGATSYFTYSAVNSFKRYFQHPITVHVQDGMHPTLPFPAITICSDTLADREKIYANDSSHSFHKYNLNISACAATADVRAGAPCGHALVCAFVPMTYDTSVMLDNCTPEYQYIITQALIKSNVTFDLLEFIYTFGESWEEVLKFCIHGLGFKDCTNTTLYKKTTKDNNLCYTLNNDNNMPILSDIQGSTGGLYLLLKNRPERYFYPKYTQGYKVYIHERGTGLGDSEIPSPPGSMTKISIQREKYELLEKGNGGKCEKRSLQGYKTYNRFDCYDECISNLINKNCGCRPAFSGVYNDSLACHSHNQMCANYQYSLVSFDNCDCPDSCNQTKYVLSVRYGQLASRNLEGVSKMFFFDDYSEENFLAIQVYYESHRGVLYKQNSSFGITALFGEIGGNMGLLLGCSVLTLAEFLFLIVSLLMNCFRGRAQVVNLTNQPNNGWN